MKEAQKNLLKIFKDDVQNFKSDTSYVSFFDLSECELYHILFNSDKEYVKLVRVLPLVKDLQSENENVSSKAATGIMKCNIDTEILNAVQNKEITSVLMYDNKIFFLSNIARSMIAQKCKCTGNMYDGTILSDVILQANMLAYKPTGKTSIRYPIAVIRKFGKSLMLAGVLSKPPADIETVFDYELQNNCLVFHSYEKSINGFQAVFDVKQEIEGYILSIVINWSDTGRGNKKVFAIRPAGAKTPIPLYETDEEYKLETLINNAQILINEKDAIKVVKNPVNVLSKNKGFEMIGKRRIKKYFSQSDLKVSEKEFYKKVLSFPDIIGKINASTDMAFVYALGDSFKSGAFVTH